MPAFANLVVCALLLLGVGASDVNWGKKVQCFKVEGTVICPGCNQRAGLSCPRSLKNSRNCLEPSTEKSPPFPPTTLEPSTEKPYTYPSTPQEPNTQKPYTYPTTAEETMHEDINSTDTTIFPTSTKPAESNEIVPAYTKHPIDMTIHPYRLLPHGFFRYRYARDTELQQMALEEEEDICDWNADCPCPLICCKTGPGCPKKCVMGIRLPPPWG